MARDTQAKARPANASKKHAARASRPGRPSTAGTDGDVQALLDGFVEAITSGDGKAAAACFDYPALMVMDGSTQPLQEPEAVAAFFGRAREQYNAQGIEDTRADVEGVEWLNDGLALVRAHFPFLDGDGKEMGDGETSMYLMRRRKEGGLGLCVAIPLGTDSGRDVA